MAKETAMEGEIVEQTRDPSILDDADEGNEKGFVLGSLLFFLVVFSPFVLFLMFKFSKTIVEDQPEDFHYAAMQWLGAFSVAAGFGALGVWTSFLSRRTNQLEPAKIKFGYTTILAYLLGCILGSIFLLLFVGNFLSGNLFPDLKSEDAFVKLTIHLTDWAKIMVWCFVSGFSERLIPNFLDDLVAKVTIKDSKADAPIRSLGL
jgi:hypothetical protein